MKYSTWRALGNGKVNHLWVIEGKRARKILKLFKLYIGT